jgi:predicted NAD/FAD-dependent oxidoreductase
MSALTRHLSTDLDAHWQTRVGRIERAPGGWVLHDTDGQSLGHWQQVIVATPAPQAVPLLKQAPNLAAFAASAEILPCWALMLGFDAPLTADFDACAVDTGPLSWIARNSSKPGRDAAESWVVHAGPEWSAAHLEEPPAAIIPQLREAFAQHVPHPEPVVQMAHRWRYARVAVPGGAPCRYNRANGIGVCGDWCLGPRVEAAWLSGEAMATILTAMQG